MLNMFAVKDKGIKTSLIYINRRILNISSIDCLEFVSCITEAMIVIIVWKECLYYSISFIMYLTSCKKNPAFSLVKSAVCHCSANDFILRFLQTLRTAPALAVQLLEILVLCMLWSLGHGIESVFVKFDIAFH